MRLLVATRNPHKTREIQEILGNSFDVLDLRTHPEISEIIESGKTFEENAIIKALAVSGRSPELVLADDSGLEVDSLGGAPGVFSSRYSGDGATDQRNIDKLLDEVANTCIEQRSARFRCVMALAQNGAILETFAGAVEGRIIDQPRGTTGFGYDPIFIPNEFEQTFGELPPKMKNAISHRAVTLKKVRNYLEGDYKSEISTMLPKR